MLLNQLETGTDPLPHESPTTMKFINLFAFLAVLSFVALALPIEDLGARDTVDLDVVLAREPSDIALDARDLDIDDMQERDLDIYAREPLSLFGFGRPSRRRGMFDAFGACQSRCMPIGSLTLQTRCIDKCRKSLFFRMNDSFLSSIAGAET